MCKYWSTKGLFVWIGWEKWYFTRLVFVRSRVCKLNDAHYWSWECASWRVEVKWIDGLLFALVVSIRARWHSRIGKLHTEYKSKYSSEADGRWKEGKKTLNKPLTTKLESAQRTRAHGVCINWTFYDRLFISCMRSISISRSVEETPQEK